MVSTRRSKNEEPASPPATSEHDESDSDDAPEEVTLSSSRTVRSKYIAVLCVDVEHTNMCMDASLCFHSVGLFTLDIPICTCREPFKHDETKGGYGKRM